MKRSAKLALVWLGVFVAATALGLPAAFRVVTVTAAVDPPMPSDPAFPGEPAPAKPPPPVPERTDPPRPDGLTVNSSSAAIRLDVRPIRPEGEAHLDKIYPTYQLATDFGGKEAIPSASLLASKCRQFDDALSAAVSLAAFEGVKDRLNGARDVLRRLAAKLPAGSHAADCVGLALALADCGEDADLARLQEATRGAERRTRLLLAFLADGSAAKPAGFYTWSNGLRGLWRCGSFLDRELAGGQGTTFAGELRAVLAADPALSADYRKCVELMRLLAGRRSGLSLDELPSGELTAEAFRAEADRRGRQAAVVFLPAPDSP